MSIKINLIFQLLLQIVFLTIFSGMRYIHAQKPTFEYLTIKEGLAHNSVYAVIQDQSGFMWFGTQSGLVRYDAYSFKTINNIVTDRGKDINIRSVHSLWCDKGTSLWVGTDSDGLLLYDLRSGKWRVVIPFELINSRINGIFEDHRGQLWVATMGAGFLVLTKDGQVLKHYNSNNCTLENNNVFSFAQTSNGKVWIASAGDGIYCSDLNLMPPFKIQPPDPSSNPIHSFRKILFTDSENKLWIGTEGDGLYVYNLNSGIFDHFKKDSAKDIPCNSISDIRQSSNGEMWLSSDGGGLMKCRQDGKFELLTYRYDSDNTLNTNNLLKLFFDRNEQLWICTFNGGLNIIKKKANKFIDLKQWSGREIELSNRSVLSICESKSGQIYFATDGAGIDVWNPTDASWRKLIAKNVPKGYFSQSVVKTMCEDLSGNIWIGYFNNGLDCYYPSTQTIRHFQKNEHNPETLSGESVWSVKQGKDGKIYVGTLDGGISVYDHNGDKFYRYLNEPGQFHTLGDNRIFDILPDDNGNFWVATQNNGLDYFVSSEQKFIHFRKEDLTSTLSANDTRCIYRDSKGRIWIGTESGGLNLLNKDGSFQRITEKDGLLSNSVMSITEDSQGNLWLSGFQGLSRFNPNDKKINNFDFHVPHNSNQFNQNSCAALRSGLMCFGGINGVSFFNPANILSDEIIPDVHFTEFRLFNYAVNPNDERGILQQSIDATSEINLAYDQYPFSIEFSSLNFADPFNTEYSYMLKGADQNWQLLEKGNRSVNFNSLSPGTYFLMVKACSSTGIWDEKCKTLKIIIHPPFWKTWWFRMLGLICTITIVYRGVQFYNRRREERWNIALMEQEKTILSLQNEKLAQENESKASELMSKAMQMGHNKEIMQSLKEGLESLRLGQSDVTLRKIRTLENIVLKELNDEDNWKQLSMYFDQVNHHFTEKLLSTYPHLTQNDLRICILVKLNLSIKEMAALLNVSIQGIEKSKYRLKKRLNLGVDQDLTEFLRTFT